MKSKIIQEAIGMVGDDLIHEAKEGQNPKKHSWRRWSIIVAAVLVIVLVVSSMLEQKGGANTVLAQAKYPEMAQYPDVEKMGDAFFEKEYEKWQEDRNARLQQYDGYTDGVDQFVQKTLMEFLANSDGENKAYSPLNIYIALGMLAEVTDGNSRQQILDLLESPNIESLRKQVNAIWNANYCDDGAVTSILASSLWLSNKINYKKATLENLAKTYYTSSYQGEMGSSSFNKELQEWLNTQTGGLLKEQTSKIEMKPETVMALATTIYYQAKWQNEFLESETKSGVFHASNGEVNCDFMNQSMARNYYWGENFSATKLNLEGSGGMWFILPDDGVEVDELLTDQEALNIILKDGNGSKSKNIIVNLSVPKFDVTSENKLNEKLQNMGVTDVFDTKVANFTPLTEEKKHIILNSAEHDVRIKIDEQGCTATAFTAMMLDGSALPPEEKVDFIVDKPFLFVITAQDGLPLYIGVVNQPA